MEWFRFYDEVLDDPKVQRLPAATFRDWVNILCLVSRNEPRGIVPAVPHVAFGLRVSEKKATAILQELTEAGLLVTVAGVTSPHGWDKRQRVSDSSAERVAKHRANKEASNATGNVTPPVTRNDSGNKRETLPHARATDTETDTEAETTASAVVEGADAPPRPRPKGKSKVPVDFGVTDALEGWGAKQEPPITVADMQAEIPMFVDHFRGNGKVMADWHATFQNWMRRNRKWAAERSTTIRPAKTEYLDTNELLERARKMREADERVRIA